MDFTVALATLGQAISIAKELRELDKSFDLAATKAKMADIYISLADVKIALSDATSELHAKDAEIESLKKTIQSLRSGESCPICGEGTMKVVSIKPHGVFGAVGVNEKTTRCEKCGHQQSDMINPK